MIYTVTMVRRESSSDGHRHIEGVVTNAGNYFTRVQVADSIIGGDIWKTRCEGYAAMIEVTAGCPHPECATRPYIRANPESTEKDNLENLPEG